MAEPVDRSDPRLWRMGVLYVNPADPAVSVPKRLGRGVTLNFARWASWAIMGALFLPAVAVMLIVALVSN